MTRKPGQPPGPKKGCEGTGTEPRKWHVGLLSFLMSMCFSNSKKNTIPGCDPTGTTRSSESTSAPRAMSPSPSNRKSSTLPAWPGAGHRVSTQGLCWQRGQEDVTRLVRPCPCICVSRNQHKLPTRSQRPGCGPGWWYRGYVVCAALLLRLSFPWFTGNGFLIAGMSWHLELFLDLK